MKLEGTVEAKGSRLTGEVSVDALGPSTAVAPVQFRTELGDRETSAKLSLTAEPGKRAIGSFTFQIVLQKGLPVGSDVVLRVTLNNQAGL